MVDVGERGADGVAPGFGVEVEGENEVGLEVAVHLFGSRADLSGAVEEAFGFGLQAGGVDGAALFAEVADGDAFEFFRA